MKKDFKILQQLVSIDRDNTDNKMILIFTENNRTVGITIITFPSWFKFWDNNFKYYPFCHN